MTLKYESEIIKEIVDMRGHESSLTHYESECIESWIEEVKGGYPKLVDYQSEWLNYIVENTFGEIVLDGSQTLQSHSINQGDTLMILISDPSISFKQNSNNQESWDFSDMICDKELIGETNKWDSSEWKEGYNIVLISSALSNTYNINSFVLAIRKSYFNVQSIDEFKSWLTQNPLTIQYKLAKESIKTVELTVTDQDGNTTSINRPIEE